MALIEGVGDEVTLLFGSLLVLMVLFLAWISTRTPELLEQPISWHRIGSDLQDTPLPTDTASASGSVTETSTTPATASQDEEGSEPGGGQGVRNRGGGEDHVAQRNMVVRLKFLNDTERTAQVQPQDTIGYIKRTYFAGQEGQVRLIYQGQLLQDDAQTLASLNLAHNCVLHCHISQHVGGAAASAQRPADQVQVALNVGSLMVPLLVLMLSVLWYCQIQYRQFFTAPATASLVGVTILLSLVAFGVYRR
ncbi:transmembrane and ubiquitin-like domain-containing protein 1 [Gouania willdenowi]|uniref:Transmembrane and ubiquitin-like domain-containing protein 1 n=1 Tax=Gouania willdenowi TaxID=441366 RepID=A0A8C5DA08_GOUWI|nr:transmembrane and ubiquitin-like domain-containing protein 1 [Gouania willdenowi]